MFITWTKVKIVINCITTAVGVILLASGILQNVFNIEENRCDMTYMFEYPEYIPVPLDAGMKSKFPKYSLILYGEGSYADDLKSLHLSGIPVLFIPGNAGSYKQVRSLGSIALRKTEDMRFHFNFFTADFKEELTALRGRYLWSQTEFVHECIKVILRLYRGLRLDVQSLVLIGHSMGGVVARGLFTLPDFDKGSVNTIIALASPNLRPPLMVDHDLFKYYSRLNELWNSMSQKEREAMKQLVIVSIGGGNRDVQVHSNLIPFGNSYLASQSFSVIASAVPKVWLSTDHRCIVWCKQLILAITRALIDMVGDGTSKIIVSATERIEILKYHLLSSSSIENSVKAAKTLLSSDSQVDISSCKLLANKQYLQSSQKLERKCFLLNVTKDMEDIHVVYTGTLTDWIGECESITKCHSYSSIASKTEIISAKGGMIKVIAFSGEQYLKGNRTILLRLNDPRKERLHVKINYKGSNAIYITSPLSLASHGLYLSNQRTFLRLRLPFLRVPWFSYRMFINTTCKQKDASITAKLRIPWLKEDVLRVFDKSLDLQLVFNIEIPAGFGYQILHSLPLLAKFLDLDQQTPSASSDLPEVLFWFNSKCDFDVKTFFDFTGTTGQLLKFSYENIIRWVTVLSLLLLAAEHGTSFAHYKHHSVYIFLIMLQSIFNLKVLSFEGLVLVVFDLLIAYSLVSLLLLLAQLLNFFSKYFGLIVSGLVSFSRRYIKSQHSTDRQSSNSFMIFGQTLLLVGLSLQTCGGVALAAFIAITIFKGTLPWKKPKSLYFIIIQLCFHMPNAITWFKDREEGFRSDFDLASWTCAFFIIGIQVITYFDYKTTTGDSFFYYSMTCALGLFIFYSNLDICWMSQLLTIAVLVHCVIYKKGMVKQTDIGLYSEKEDNKFNCRR